MKALWFAASVLCVSACATAPTDISLGEPTSSLKAEGAGAMEINNEAILVLSIGPVGTAGTYQFQRLNESQTDFVEKPVYLGFGAWGVGDKMQRPDDEKSNLWVLDQKEINFLIKKVEAGTYVANYVSWNTFNGVSSGQAWSCLDEGAYAFEILPGEINIVSSVSAFPRGSVSRLAAGTTDEDVLDQFERTRLNHPDLKGEPVLVAPHAEARWTEKEGGLFSADCEMAEPGSLSLSRIATEADAVAAPDDAELSAIEAALQNLKNDEAKEAPEGDTQ
ncbi:MAG: hypothetical protein AAFQ22_06575 [Pseudomonadota bacterium]